MDVNFNEENIELYNMFYDAVNLSKSIKNNNEKLAIYNYIGNLYSAINLSGESKMTFNQKAFFSKSKNFERFLKQADLYAIKYCDNFLKYKNFHEQYLNLINSMYLEDYNELGILNYRYGQSEFTKKEFSNILFDFYNHYNLLDKFKEFVSKQKLFSKIKHRDRGDYEGITIFNPLNNDTAVLINDFDYDFDSMFTLVHEFGHVLDLTNLDENGILISKINDYSYLSSYSEVVSKLFEKLFLQYLIDKNICKDSAIDKLIDTYITNYDFLFSAYLYSILDNKYYNNYRCLTMNNSKLSHALIEKYFDKDFLLKYLQEVELDLYSDSLYTYGDILSLGLKDPVINEGFESPDFKDFLNFRVDLFNPEQLNRNCYNINNLRKTYKKEINECKK